MGRILLREALRLRGFNVDSVSNSDELYEYLTTCGAAAGLQAVVADLRNRGRSLRRCLEWCREHHQSAAFVVVTADTRWQETWLTSADVPVLAKPIHVGRLVRLLAPRVFS